MYTFVKIKNNFDHNSKPYWMLYITDSDQLYDYLLNIRAKTIANDYWNFKERIIKRASEEELTKSDEDNAVNNDTEKILNIIFSRNTNRKTIDDDFKVLDDTFLVPLINAFNRMGNLLIAPNGSWMFKLKEIDILETVESETYTFPKNEYSYQEYVDKISIKKWENGTHFYARIGEEDVKDDNGNTKWNTYERAMEVSINYIKNNLIKI